MNAAEGALGAGGAGAAAVVSDAELPASSPAPAAFERSTPAAAGDAGAVEDESGVRMPDEEKPATNRGASPSCRGSSVGALFFIWASLASSAAI